MINGKEYVSCNGSQGFGYCIKTWMDKTGYLRRQGRKGEFNVCVRDFVADLKELVRSVGLKVRFKKNDDSKTEDVLLILASYGGRIKKDFNPVLKMFLPSDLEEKLKQRLSEEGIDAVDDLPDILHRTNIPDGIIPAQLRTLRKKAGMTQNELGKRLQVSTNLVSLWERGKKPIAIHHTEQLRKLLNIQ